MTSNIATALMVHGGWEGHSPAESADIMVPAIEAAGLSVSVETSLEVYADVDYISGFDVIIQNWTMGEILPDELRGLTTAVARGTGLAGWHGGIVDSFRMATDYLQMVGGQFAAHPHDIVDYEVNICSEHRDNSILDGMADFSVHSEQYWMLTDPLSTVLATTLIPVREDDPWHEPVLSPVLWTRKWGKGRIFVNTIGHTPGDLVIPQIQQLTVRGIQWAAGVLK